MAALLLIPVVISLLVMGAHFLRSGSLPLLVGVFVLLGLLGVRQRWAARVVQAALVLGALEWVRTLLQLSSMRAQAGAPATRMAVILGVVALVTLLSALVFFTPPLKRWYAPPPGRRHEPGNEATRDT
jgi:hypothetical protein